MNLRTDLVTSVAAQYSATPSPRLARLVKSPELASPFTAVVLDNGAVGISYNLFHGDPAAMERYQAWDPADLVGHLALELMDRFLADDLFQRTIGFAVLNALCQTLFLRDPQAHGLDFSVRLLDLLAPSPTDTVGLVGYFPPTAHYLLGRVAELVVLERSATLLVNDYPFTMSSDPASLGRCDKVLITATTILNDTLEGLLTHCSNASFVAVMGPSAGICPGPLFALGVDAVGGTFIRQPELFLARFARGEKWGDAKCKFVAQR